MVTYLETTPNGVYVKTDQLLRPVFVTNTMLELIAQATRVGNRLSDKAAIASLLELVKENA